MKAFAIILAGGRGSRLGRFGHASARVKRCALSGAAAKAGPLPGPNRDPRWRLVDRRVVARARGIDGGLPIGLDWSRRCSILAPTASTVYDVRRYLGQWSNCRKLKRRIGSAGGGGRVHGCKTYTKGRSVKRSFDVC